ncbi:hypothetical protein BB561_003534 [Smittium simulii]|uniref:Exocyst complex component SEC5 n=1 Tax=Smittium simulii TaxID=133385 RepID=A0A2T9YKT9_9FUNG|nr:hypothetical protein BB561_003534 [Smittium simulii]
MNVIESEVLSYYDLPDFNITSWSDIKPEENDDRKEDLVDNTADQNFEYFPEDPALQQDQKNTEPQLDAVPSKSFRYAPVFKDYDPLGLKPSILDSVFDPNASLGNAVLSNQGTYFVSHKQFSPKQFLTRVHGKTSFQELCKGASGLKKSMAQRSEALKVLVQNNFDSFVDAKNKIDFLYQQMIVQGFKPSDDFGTKNFTIYLQNCSKKADEIYNPIIHRRSKAEQIRSTLSVIGRYRFFFNLPYVLIENSRLGKFDSAVREYRKGLAFYNQLKQLGRTSNYDSDQATPLDHIVDKIWKEVQSSITELKSALFRHLAQSYRPLDTQEAVIRHLYDLGSSLEHDPVAFYLKRQHEWILDQLEEVQQSLISKQQSLRRTTRPIYKSQSEAKEISINRRVDELQRSLQSQGIADYNTGSSNFDEDFAQWTLIFSSIKALSTTLVRCIPDFWSLAQAYKDRKYLKDIDNRKYKTDQNLGLRLIESLLLEYAKRLFSMLNIYKSDINYDNQLDKFSILDIDEKQLNGSKKNASMPNFGSSADLPQTHTLLTGYFMTGIVETVANSANDIIALEISSELYHILNIIILQLKSGLILALSDYWYLDSKTFHLLENWNVKYGTDHWPKYYVSRKKSQSSGSGSAEDSASIIEKGIANTEIVAIFLRAQQSILAQVDAFCTASIRSRNKIDESTNHKILKAETTAGKLYKIAIKISSNAFFDSIYSFLDSLHFLAMSSDNLKPKKMDFLCSAYLTGLPQNQYAKSENYCILVTLCNMQAFRIFVIPDILHSRTVKSVLGVNLQETVPILEKMFRRLDENIFNKYVWHKSKHLTEIITQGILMSGFSWTTSQESVTEIHPYINKSLLYLVFVHAEISELVTDPRTTMDTNSYSNVVRRGSTAPVKHQPLIKRVLQALYNRILLNILSCFRSVDSFTKSALVQAVLEILFINHILADFITPATQEICRLVFTYLSQTWTKAKNKSTSGVPPSPSLQQGMTLDGKKQELAGVDTDENSQLVSPPSNLSHANPMQLSQLQWEMINKLLKACINNCSIQFRCFQS